jgi:hypothetical protein
VWYGEAASQIDRWRDDHMNNNEKSAATADEFVALTKDKSIQRIVVHGDLVNVPSVIKQCRRVATRHDKQRPTI